MKKGEIIAKYPGGIVAKVQNSFA